MIHGGHHIHQARVMVELGIERYVVVDGGEETQEQGRAAILPNEKNLKSEFSM